MHGRLDAGLLITCGSSVKQTVSDTKVTYILDDGFTFDGNKTAIKTKGLLPILTTLRYFPDMSARKYCYKFQAIKGGKYLVRTIYCYGGFDGGKEPPVFDQIIGGTKWSVVNTTQHQDNLKPKTNTRRVFSVAVNGKTLYSNLNVTTGGVTVYAPQWPVSWQTQISLTPDAKSSDGPLINAGEIYQILPLGGRTLTRDGS
ncbi:hypothetical protein CRYUN_Cryun06bG0050100 [Craigia yunnanensis]